MCCFSFNPDHVPFGSYTLLRDPEHHQCYSIRDNILGVRLLLITIIDTWGGEGGALKEQRFMVARVTVVSVFWGL